MLPKRIMNGLGLMAFNARATELERVRFRFETWKALGTNPASGVGRFTWNSFFGWERTEMRSALSMPDQNAERSTMSQRSTTARVDTSSVESSVTWFLLALGGMFLFMVTVIVKDMLDARVTNAIEERKAVAQELKEQEISVLSSVSTIVPDRDSL